MSHADPISMRTRLASRLLDLSRPPAGWGGTPSKLTSTKAMGFGVALGCVMEAVLRAEDDIETETRLVLIAQGIAFLQAEFLAAAPPDKRAELSATLQLMAIQEADRMAAAHDAERAASA